MRNRTSLDSPERPSRRLGDEPGVAPFRVNSDGSPEKSLSQPYGNNYDTNDPRQMGYTGYEQDYQARQRELEMVSSNSGAFMRKGK